VEGAAQRTASDNTNPQKPNYNNRNNHNTSSRPPDAVQTKPQTSTTQSAGGSRPAAVSGTPRPQQNQPAGRPSALTQAKVSKVSFAQEASDQSAGLEVPHINFNNISIISTDNMNDNNNNNYHEPNHFAILDSGSSIHTVPSEHYLTNITSSSSLGLDVRAANNTPIAIQSVGDFILNDEFILPNVCVAPSIVDPLVSVPLLLVDDNIVIFSKNKSLILKNNQEITSSFDSFVKFAENRSPSIPIIHDLHNNLLKIDLTPPLPFYPFLKQLYEPPVRNPWKPPLEGPVRTRLNFSLPDLPPSCTFYDLKNPVNHIHRYSTVKTRTPAEEVSLWHRIMGHCDLDTLITLTRHYNYHNINFPQHITPGQMRKYFPYDCPDCPAGNLQQRHAEYSPPSETSTVGTEFEVDFKGR
jgi:hypothetical protein